MKNFTSNINVYLFVLSYGIFKIFLKYNTIIIA